MLLRSYTLLGEEREEQHKKFMFKDFKQEPRVLAHPCNLSMWEEEAGR